MLGTLCGITLLSGQQSRERVETRYGERLNWLEDLLENWKYVKRKESLKVQGVVAKFWLPNNGLESSLTLMACRTFYLTDKIEK